MPSCKRYHSIRDRIQYHVIFKQQPPLKRRLVKDEVSKNFRFPEVDTNNEVSIKSLSLEAYYQAMKQVVAKWPRINFKFLKAAMPSLSDSSSLISLVYQDCFGRNIRLKLWPAKGQEGNTNHLFGFKSANEGGIP